ncbi:MAG TPA: nicotinate phosphoribosyltransferase [Alphaproteobacteria bacterium]|nr:nicotinate phosphoribosyltransferase [Alphaproteobacteria bacterium]
MPFGPSASDLPEWTDAYFSRTRAVVERYGDSIVTYAVFMRRPVVAAPRLAVEWLKGLAAERRFKVEIEFVREEGQWVGAGEPMLYITGSLAQLVETETLFLMKIGPASVAAYNAFTMCADLPSVAFLAMEARHCAGLEMETLMAYAASVGSARAKRKAGAIGFVGNATPATAHFFGRDHALGTMPHGLIGYAGSTLRAAEMFVETFPDQNPTILVDYFGREVTDAIEVCRRYPEIASEGRLSFRLDTPGSRFLEGLDTQLSYEVLDRHARDAIRGYRTEDELRHLIGPGVSAAAIWRFRDSLDAAGFPAAKIVASSGFGPAKCKMMAAAEAPIDVIGTGSFLPGEWGETYATADIVAYDGVPRVKVGREFLLRP